MHPQAARFFIALVAPSVFLLLVQCSGGNPTPPIPVQFLSCDQLGVPVQAAQAQLMGMLSAPPGLAAQPNLVAGATAAFPAVLGQNPGAPNIPALFPSAVAGGGMPGPQNPGQAKADQQQQKQCAAELSNITKEMQNLQSAAQQASNVCSATFTPMVQSLAQGYIPPSNTLSQMLSGNAGLSSAGIPGGYGALPTGYGGVLSGSGTLAGGVPGAGFPSPVSPLGTPNSTALLAMGNPMGGPATNTSQAMGPGGVPGTISVTGPNGSSNTCSNAIKNLLGQFTTTLNGAYPNWGPAQQWLAGQVGNFINGIGGAQLANNPVAIAAAIANANQYLAANPNAALSNMAQSYLGNGAGMNAPGSTTAYNNLPAVNLANISGASVLPAAGGAPLTNAAANVPGVGAVLPGYSNMAMGSAVAPIAGTSIYPTATGGLGSGSVALSQTAPFYGQNATSMSPLGTIVGTPLASAGVPQVLNTGTTGGSYPYASNVGSGASPYGPTAYGPYGGTNLGYGASPYGTPSLGMTAKLGLGTSFGDRAPASGNQIYNDTLHQFQAVY